MHRSRSFYISKRKRVAAARGLKITCTAAAVVSVLWFFFHAFASGSVGAETDTLDDPASPFSRPLFKTGNKTPTIYEDSDSYFLETLSHRVVYSNNVRSVELLDDHSAEPGNDHNADFLGHSVEDNGNAFNLFDDEDASYMEDNPHAATTVGADAPRAVGVNATTSAGDGLDGAAFLDVERASEPRTHVDYVNFFTTLMTDKPDGRTAPWILNKETGGAEPGFVFLDGELLPPGLKPQTNWERRVYARNLLEGVTALMDKGRMLGDRHDGLDYVPHCLFVNEETDRKKNYHLGVVWLPGILPTRAEAWQMQEENLYFQYFSTYSQKHDLPREKQISEVLGAIRAFTALSRYWVLGEGLSSLKTDFTFNRRDADDVSVTMIAPLPRKDEVGTPEFRVSRARKRAEGFQKSLEDFMFGKEFTTFPSILTADDRGVPKSAPADAVRSILLPSQREKQDLVVRAVFKTTLMTHIGFVWGLPATDRADRNNIESPFVQLWTVPGADWGSRVENCDKTYNALLSSFFPKQRIYAGGKLDRVVAPSGAGT
ncbi:unnamed protein product [Amoebophrya sp. A25]|nr:unnamed protein product [Amoebophrya sp. A25]|eukprot:GSA25T00016999001.1